ncbi:MAG: Hpt domain-containing protein, partial [Ferruginibacter sp.]
RKINFKQRRYSDLNRYLLLNTMKNLQMFSNQFASSATENLYNLSLLEEMDDAEYLAEVLTLFLKEASTELKGMKDALHQRKADILCSKAHKMKSSTGVIQANELTEYLDRIEKIAKAGTINDELRSLVEKAGQLYNLLEQALKKHMKELSQGPR